MAQPMNAVNWIEIPVTDLARAKAFYEHVLGMALSLNEMGPLKMAWFPMIQGAMGAAGALVKADGYTPSRAGSLVYFTVEDIDAALKRAAAKGGRVLNPKWSIGPYGFVAHFEDCEGNRVALHLEDVPAGRVWYSCGCERAAAHVCGTSRMAEGGYA